MAKKTSAKKTKKPAKQQIENNLATKLAQQSGVMTPAAATKPFILPPGKHVVLHIGAGRSKGFHPNLPEGLSRPECHELTLDFVPTTTPDILATPRQFVGLEDKTVDTIWCKFRLERLYFHEFQPFLKECLRVLKPGGKIYVTSGDLQRIGEHLYRNGLESFIRPTPKEEEKTAPRVGDMLFGPRTLVEQHPFAVHRSGFTVKFLASHLKIAGFSHIRVERDLKNARLLAQALKVPEGAQRRPEPEIVNDDINEMMVKRDQIDQPPVLWKGFPPKK